MKTNAILLMDPGTHTAYFQNRNPERQRNKNYQRPMWKKVTAVSVCKVNQFGLTNKCSI